MEFIIERYELFIEILPWLLKGLAMTFKISMFSIIIGSLLGFFLGILRTLDNKIISNIIGLYLHIFRGTPYLVQLYLIYFVLPSFDVEFLKFDSFTAAIVSLSLYTSSYVTEIVTSAINAVPKGQSEGAQSVGMTRFQALYHIVIPQALKLTIPPMSGVYVIIIKSTAVLSVIGISELTRQGEIAILRLPENLLYIYLLIAVMYFIYCYPVLRFATWAEKRYGSIGVDP